jgi:hypothetical protein
MVYTIIDKKTGEVLYGATADQIENIPEGQIAIDEQPTELLDNMHFDFETKTFYEKK